MSEPITRGSGWPWGAFLAAACFAFAPSCLERHDAGPAAADSRCSSCHGDATRAGDSLQRSAPPRDLHGASGTTYPGVGAHAIHVYAGKTHGSVACNECHVVPERTDSAGHADSAGPAEIVFGPLAIGVGRTPRYDGIARTCSDTACHGDHAEAVWTEPRASAAACGTCHGLPPALPHPQSQRCAACHGQVLDSDRHFLAPELHVDGVVQTSQSACTTCHGSGDDPAPPSDTLGNQSSAAIGVGAHQVHLNGGAFSRPVPCSECHVVPGAAEDAGHIEGRAARVALTAVAASGSHIPSWNRATASCNDTWCHGPSAGAPTSSPSWTASADLGCTSCHGAPPPAPHPQLGNCSGCHGAVVAADNVSIIDRSRHVNGVVDVAFDANCTACHGAINAAPPRALGGESTTSYPGVGAHQAHLATGARSRSVLCSDCHLVPKKVLDPGHLDSALPAEVQFSSAAVAFGGNPSYDNGACQQTSCHGGKFPGTHRSGGSNPSPQWTSVGVGQASCGACHSLPPPAPHPYQNDCSSCHEDVAKNNVDFVRPELHVDGVVTFTLP